VDDGQGKPRDAERADLAARIRRVADQGRISAADRDIRLRNVESAQSRSELDLMARDLDQLETTIAPGAAAPVPASSPQLGVPSTGVRVEVNRRNVVIAVVFVVAAVTGLGGLVAFSARGSHGSSDSATVTDDGLLDPVAPSLASPSVPSPDSSGPSGTAAGSAYRLDVPGIRWFLDAYRTKFATTEVVDLTMYDDYVVVQVPQPGTHRHTGLLYRPANGWQDFGGVTADFPGSKPVDLTRLDVRALVRNIAKARESLNVDDVSQTYVIVDYRPDFDATANVDIHVANSFGESGYLATTLDGSVERAFPYQS
jgi:hypothetical protein